MEATLEKPAETQVVVKETDSLLKKSEISIWLDTYDDIFSDFDPRPYSQRALSDDFLNETKKASRDKASGSIQLSFLVPKSLRNTSNESLIRKRLREHFKKHHSLLYDEIMQQKKRGYLLLSVGILIMFTSTFILFKFPEKNLFINFLLTLFEPAGWFLFWEGMSEVIFRSSTKKPDLEFYDKMIKCDILFFEY
jgi:Fe2+ transport system protein B